jgi:hypothetical protein
VKLASVCAGAVILTAPAAPHAAECRDSTAASAGHVTMAIAELYTAEGCDSCPPADKWFSSLSARKGNAIPLAFHVDYWDGGGWKDRFAKPAFTRRQQEAVVRLGSRTVVTPQLFVNGKVINVSTNDDKRGSVYSRFNKRVSEVSAMPPKAELKLTTSVKDDAIETDVSVKLGGSGADANAAAWLAVTENNLVSRVTAGENSGVTLYHDHVVRELIGPLALTETAPQKILLGKDWKQKDLSVVAFVQDRLTGEVLQAVSVEICGK